MLVLALIGFLGGVVTGLSPCILPVLPVVFVAGGAAPVPKAASVGAGAQAGGSDPGTTLVLEEPTKTRNTRPYLVIAGLIVSFSVFTLLGTALLSALHLPQDFLRDVGLVVLIAVGLGLIFPKIGELLERPFARLPKRQVNRDGSAFVLGLGLGLLFVPCAGPVLTAITVVSATGQIGLQSVVLTVAFAIGAALPLLVFALAGAKVGERVRGFRDRASTVRRIGGVILIVVALAIGFNLTDNLQRALPGYTSALQQKIEGNSSVQDRLQGLTGNSTALAACEGSNTLKNCGPAPAFTGIQQWMNTPNDGAIKLADLKGKVVLIDFWTYSCINCQRTLPHIEAWDAAYKDSGLVTIGVHTPEFSFERVPDNVKKGAASLGVKYPIAIDNSYSTWTAYGNRYWPAQYLVDANGDVRATHFGEGNYGRTEGLIRQLLQDAKPGVKLPAATDVADSTPETMLTVETYLGYNRMGSTSTPDIANGKTKTYPAVSEVAQDSFALTGQWTVSPQYVKAGTDASLQLRYRASQVFLVLGGEGSITPTVNGERKAPISVSGEPRLYTLVDSTDTPSGLLDIAVTPGVSAYVFTFG